MIYLNCIKLPAVFLLCAVGLVCCESPDTYRPACFPHATLEVSGTITNQEAKPLGDIRIAVLSGENGQVWLETYSKEDGTYTTIRYDTRPELVWDIIAEDTSGMYAPDTVRVEVVYDRSTVPEGDALGEGTAKIHKDFSLHKQ